MSAELFLNCRHKHCSEHALSFSEFCWEHVDREQYAARLVQGVRQTASRQSLALNLKKVTASGVDFSKLDLRYSSLSQAHFSNCHFIGANLSGTDLIGARFSHTDFVGANLSGANLTRAVFDHASLSFTDLRGAYLVEAHFREVDFMGAVLFQSIIWNADLSGAKHLKKKNFRDPDAQRHSHARLAEDNALVAFESYRALKHYFYQHGLYEDASWAAYRELTTERRHFFRTADLRFFPSLLMDLLSGYTEKPNRVIVSSLFTVLFFGIAYFFLDAAQRTGYDPAYRANLWESIYFSFITFATVGYGDFVPRPIFWYQVLACIEAFSGPFMAGLYIFTLTRRYAAG